MTTRSDICAAVAAAAERSQIVRVTLFGSYARGEQTDGSDVDLLVEAEEGFSLFDAARFRRKVSEALGLDVDMVSRRAASGDFAKEAFADEVTVYDVA